MKNDKIRAGIYGLAALYMFYIAVKLFQEGGNGIAAAFFVMAGTGLIVFSFIIARHITKEEKKRAEEKMKETETDEK